MINSEEEWVKKHFGPLARISGDCSCGNKMGQDDYEYHGGTYGLYTCQVCGRKWTVDLNGAMWPSFGSKPSISPEEKTIAINTLIQCGFKIIEPHGSALLNETIEKLEYHIPTLKYSSYGSDRALGEELQKIVDNLKEGLGLKDVS